MPPPLEHRPFSHQRTRVGSKAAGSQASLPGRELRLPASLRSSSSSGAPGTCLHPPVTVRALGAAPSGLVLGIQQDFFHVTVVNGN